MTLLYLLVAIVIINICLAGRGLYKLQKMSETVRSIQSRVFQIQTRNHSQGKLRLKEPKEYEPLTEANPDYKAYWARHPREECW